MRIIDFFNLEDYEKRDLQTLIHFYKKWDGYTYEKLNKIDKIVAKEHDYASNRVHVFDIWMLCGIFLPMFIVLMMFGVNSYISLVVCVVIGMIGEVVYQNSCDKIDYNHLVKKNQQLNLFKDCGMDFISNK